MSENALCNLHSYQNSAWHFWIINVSHLNEKIAKIEYVNQSLCSFFLFYFVNMNTKNIGNAVRLIHTPFCVFDNFYLNRHLRLI